MTNATTEARREKPSPRTAYEEAKRRLARVRGVAESIALWRLRRATSGDAPEHVGHYPEDTH